MPHTSPDTLVIVFARVPQPGAAKTRLIPLLGAEGAAAFHAKLVKRALTTAAQAHIGPVELHGTPGIDDPFLRFCSGRYGIALQLQRGADLGARMLHAFETALARYSQVVLIGCDCPVLTAHHLYEAHTALTQGNDAVLVPAEDGGYALIGLTRCDARLFSDIAWGTDRVLATTRVRLRQLGWRWRELETLWDIDRPEDYQRWCALEETCARSPA